MSTFNIKKIEGNNNIIGDNNFVTNNFYQHNPNINFTEIDKQLVDIIYENTSTEEERKEILNSLIDIKTETNLNQNSGSIKKLERFAKGVGQFALEIVKKIIADKISNS